MNNKFREEVEFFHPVFKAVYVLAVLFVVWIIVTYPFDPPLVIPVILLFGIPLLFGRMIITMDREALLVSYGYVNLLKKRILLSDIKGVEKVTFRPLRDFGGWGIRSGKFNGERTGCYNLRGNQGVLLDLSCDIRVCVSKTRRVIIGSQQPEKLIETINSHKS